MQSSCIAQLFLNLPAYSPATLAAEAAAVLDMVILRQAARAVAARALGRASQQVSARTLSGQKCGRGGGSGLVHAANQLPGNAAYLYWPKFLKKSMPDTKNPGLRLRLLDECLQRRQKIWTPARLFEAVADKFQQATGRQFSKSQFNLDIKALREEYSAPLAYGRDQGYHYTEPGFSILGSPLVQADADVLRQALAMLQQFQGLGLSDELHELAQRVAGHLQAQPVAEAAQQLISFEQVSDYAGAWWLGPLYQAIRGRQVLVLRYRPFGAAEAWEATVQPYLLKQYNHRWFLIGEGTGRPGLSNYALDRIESLAPATAQAYLPPPADLAARFDNIVGVSVPDTGSQPTPVRLRFRASRGQYVRTKPLHPSQQVTSETTASLEITLHLIPTQELETLLLSFGDDVEVLTPVSLREQIEKRLRAATSLYVNNGS